jgi:hypothetical protein
MNLFHGLSALMNQVLLRTWEDHRLLVDHNTALLFGLAHRSKLKRKADQVP